MYRGAKVRSPKGLETPCSVWTAHSKLEIEGGAPGARTYNIRHIIMASERGSALRELPDAEPLRDSPVAWSSPSQLKRAYRPRTAGLHRNHRTSHNPSNTPCDPFCFRTRTPCRGAQIQASRGTATVGTQQRFGAGDGLGSAWSSQAS